MTGQELLDELDIPVGQYRLSVKFPEDSERVGVPKNFSGNMTEYRYTLKDLNGDDVMAFPFYGTYDLMDKDNSFCKIMDFFSETICDALNESLVDYDDFCNRLGYDAYEENDYGDIVQNAAAFDIQERLNAFREMIQKSLPFDELQNTMYYGIRNTDGEQVVLPSPHPSRGADMHVSTLLQAMLDEVEYIDHNGTSHSIKMEALAPDIAEWLSKDIDVPEMEPAGMGR